MMIDWQLDFVLVNIKHAERKKKTSAIQKNKNNKK